MYHFSAPMTSWKPSEELSEPLRLLAEAPGMGKAFAVGEVERWYGAACCLVGWNWAEACTAAVVAPGEEGPALVVIVRDEFGGLWFGVCEAGEGLCVYDAAAWAAVCGPVVFCTADWARKAARKPEKNGLFDDMVPSLCAGAREKGRENKKEASGRLLSAPHAAGGSLGWLSDSRPCGRRLSGPGEVGSRDLRRRGLWTVLSASSEDAKACNTGQDGGVSAMTVGGTM